MKGRSKIKGMLREVGQRVTPQRVLLLEMLNREKGHLDAGELYLRAKKRYPQLSLSTVYRSLKLFKELGLIDELHFKEEHHHYEGKPESRHHHFVCLGCGNVTEFESDHIDALEQEVESRFDFRVTKAEVHLSGYCRKCR